MRIVRFALIFRMELARHEERMVLQLDQLDQLAVRRDTADNEIAVLLQLSQIVRIDFIAVAVTFMDNVLLIEALGFGTVLQHTVISSQTQCPVFRAAAVGRVIVVIFFIHSCDRFEIFVQHSTTAICIPRQSPRNGILCSRAY